MVLFRSIEGFDRSYLRIQSLPALFLGLSFNFFGNFCFFLILIEDCRAILTAFHPAGVIIWSMQAEKLLEQLFVTYKLRIIKNIYGFGMAGFSTANFIVIRIIVLTAGISNSCIFDSMNFSKRRFNSPESAGG